MNDILMCMTDLKFGSAGVGAREVDNSAVATQKPTGIPAAALGVSVKGPGYVPVTVGGFDEFKAKFGPSDGKKFGPLAASEWLKNAGSFTYLRIMGVGDGNQRVADGHVNQAGFTVGEKEPNDIDGTLSNNPYANSGS